MSGQPPMILSDLDDVSLSSSQGFRAMGEFLRAYFDRTGGSGLLATIVGDVELEDNGTSADPAALSDWASCVARILSEDEKS